MLSKSPVVLLCLSRSWVSYGCTGRSTKPGNNIWSGEAVPWNIASWSASISLNVVVTLGIVYRLLYMRRLMRTTLPMRNAQMYTSITAMIIESSAINTVTYNAFLISYVVDSPFQRVVLPVLTQAMVRETSSPMTCIVPLTSSPRPW